MSFTAHRSAMEPLELSAPIEPRPPGCDVPLTAEQQRIHDMLQARDPERRALSLRMCASAVRIIGVVDTNLLRASIHAIVYRHESLRTRFVTSVNMTKQHVDNAGAVELNVIDLSNMTMKEAEEEARRLTQSCVRQRIDLSVGPVFEAVLFKLSADQQALILLVDHMISDGISNALLSREIWQTYDAAVRGEVSALSPLQVQFPDYCVWLERTRHAWVRDHESYWREHLAGVPKTVLSEQQGLPMAPNGVTSHIQFGAALSARLREAAKIESTFISNVVFAIYAVVMSRWCAQEDLLIVCPVHGRHGRLEIERAIGLFVNRLHLRLKVRGNETLRDLLSQAHREMQGALDHRDFDRVPHFIPECATDLEFHWRPASWRGRASDARPRDSQQIRRQPFLVRMPEWSRKFWCVFDDTAVGICATVHYWPHLIAPSTVVRFGNHLRAVAEALVDRPDARIDSAIPVGDAWSDDAAGVASGNG